MEKDPLLPLLSPRSPPVPPSPLSLPPLPEDEEFSLCLTQTPSSLKDRLIFGPPLFSDDHSSSSLYDALNLSYASPRPSCSSDPFLHDQQHQLLQQSQESSGPQISQQPSPPPPPPPPQQQQQQWLIDPNYPLKKSNLHRSKTAPAMVVINDVHHPHIVPKPQQPSSQSVIRQACILLVVYLSLGVVIYWFNRHQFTASETHPVVDALYFCIVTMCTIGYGDITPNSTVTKLFSVLFVFVGFGFIDILLSGMVSYMLDLQENYLLKTVKAGKDARSIIVDVKKGRMRIRMKVALALGVVVLCIGIGVGFLHFVEQLGLLDAFYLSVMSVTTVGYGDRAFRTLTGRIFASIWLLVSTLAVARAFLYLAEARVDKRNRNLAKWVLGQDMTVAQFLAADIDNNGFVSKSEYVIYKLKEMGKISEKDILQVCRKFDQLDTGNCGKITLADLMEHKLTI